jgi:hypothetical protein
VGYFDPLDIAPLISAILVVVVFLSLAVGVGVFLSWMF